MGFNSRYINKKTIKSKRKLADLIKFITNPDCLIIEDEFSEKVVDIIKSGSDIKIKLNDLGLFKPIVKIEHYG